MEYTERTRHWLDEQVLASLASATRVSYYADDDQVTGVPVAQVLGLARALSVLEALAELEFSSLLDVGAGTGWLSQMVANEFGASVAAVDLSGELCVWARRAFAVPAYVANAAALPFEDDAFDVVLCSEVIEHVEFPAAALGELRRVAKKAVIVTTQESCLQGWRRRLLVSASEDAPHAERNYFLPQDLADFFGRRCRVGRMMNLPERIRLFDFRSIEDLKRCVLEITEPGAFGGGSYGLIAVAPLCELPSRPAGDRQALLDAVIASDRTLGGASGYRTNWNPPVFRREAVATLATPRPVCPKCAGDLLDSVDSLACTSCGGVFAVDRGVPTLLAPDAVVMQNEGNQRQRPELGQMFSGLGAPRWRFFSVRRMVREVLRLQDFLGLPLSGADKARIAWRRWSTRGEPDDGAI